MPSNGDDASDHCLGAIFGTGTNGAWVEDVSKITKLGNTPASALGGEMIVNTEWGAFDNRVCVLSFKSSQSRLTICPFQRRHLPTSPFDNKLDREWINPRFQAFEKFISGMYLGEVTRNVILSLIDAAPKPILFGGKSSDVLNKHYGLDTAVMSEIEIAWRAGLQATSGASDAAKATPKSITSSDFEASLSDADRNTLQNIRQILINRLELHEQDVSLRDAAVVRRIVEMVAGRAAKLSGCAVAVTLVQTGRAVLGGGPAPPARKGEEKRIGVGVDGRFVTLPFCLKDGGSDFFSLVVSLSSIPTTKLPCANLFVYWSVRKLKAVSMLVWRRMEVVSEVGVDGDVFLINTDTYTL